MANELDVNKPPQNIQTLAAFLTGQRNMLAQVAPKLDADRMRQVVLAAASKQPKLLQCTLSSIYQSVHTAAQLSLDLAGPMGHAHLVPFRDKEGQSQCTFILGYRGMIELMLRSGKISNIYAYAVHQGDTFEYELGLDLKLRHVPSTAPTPTDGSALTHVYAVCQLKDGGKQFVVMPKSEIEGIRQRSRAKEYGPWSTDYEQMALKTAIRRLFKYVPASIELAEAIEKEEQVEYVKDIEVESVDTQPTRRQKMAKRVRDAAQHALGATTETTPATGAPAPAPEPIYAHTPEDLAEAADAKAVAAPPQPGEPPPGEDGLDAADLETGEIQTPAQPATPEKPRRRGRPRKTEQAGLPFVDQPAETEPEPLDLGAPEPVQPPEPEQPPEATDADAEADPGDSEIEVPPAPAPAPASPPPAAPAAAKPATAPRLKARDMLTRMTSALGSDTPEILREKLTELVTAVNAVSEGALDDVVQKWTKGLALSTLGPTMLRKIITEAVPVAKEVLLPKESK